VPEAIIVGGADKISFLNGNNVWMMNVDGSDLEQLTNDGAEKTNLSWLPNGSGISYISGKCIWYVEVESKRVEIISCFESTEYLENFTFSPDGTQVAISVNRELYVVPWDLERLQNVRYNSDLKAMSECNSLAPLLTSSNTSVPVKYMKWSNDGQRVVLIKLANVGGQLADLIQIFSLQSCEFSPIRTDEIPASRFSLEGYNNNPRILNFGFDRETLLAMVSYTRNSGYGHLYIYHTDEKRADLKVNPISDQCCYRDPEFSPDGRYLILVFQPFEAGARAQLYYIPYGTIGTGATYEPLPLPDSFFENPREQPQPVLRPAQ
jgi:Tol biopolymer transport system component